MSQSDYNIGANPSGLNMRTELNQIFDSILTNNSGSTAPTVTSAFMMWVDTSNPTYYYLKMRNHDNTAWVTLGIYTVATKTYTSYVDNDVKLTGNQDIDDIKTFLKSPIVPTPTTGTEAVNKDYADLKVALASFIGANQSLSGSGYQKLPGGLTIQWGYVQNPGYRQLTIAFPISFPNSFLNGMVITNNDSITTDNGGSVYYVSKSGMAVALNATYSFYWFAIGY